VPTKLIVCLLTVTLAASAGEYVVLSNGFRIHADSHSTDGAVVRLQTSQGVIEIPVARVTAFETEEYQPPPPAPPKPAEPIAEVQSPNVQPKPTPQELVTLAAVHAGLPPAIVHSVAKAESGYHANAVSPKGAIGLMQLMPATAAELNADPHDPAQNAEAGARYLRDLLLKYENDPHQVSKAVAAYNAGPGAVDKYHGIPPYCETVDYVNRVLKEYEKEQLKKKTGATD
jgi:soluble lytic murein transglycosylase-like protein